MTATAAQSDVLIVGSGPAGMSTALHLLQRNGSWAERIVVLEKDVHPREKLCGGGVTRLGEQVLEGLDLTFEPDHVAVREMRLLYRGEVCRLPADLQFRVVHRSEFDHWLVRRGRERGLTVLEGQPVEHIVVRDDRVEVTTSQTTYRASVLVGADGSNGIVRRELSRQGLLRSQRSSPPLARLVEVLTPVAGESAHHRDGLASFDFSVTHQGLQGYYWDFPSLVDGRPVMNRGLFDSRAHPRRRPPVLKPVLTQMLADRGLQLSGLELKGFPIRTFSRKASFAAPRVLLAGDAAGVDPLLGEGISFALAYGEVAAAAIEEAASSGDFGFEGYRTSILRHPLLSRLTTRTLLARLIYHFGRPTVLDLIWRLLSRRLPGGVGQTV